MRSRRLYLRTVALSAIGIVAATISYRTGSAACESTCDDDQCLKVFLGFPDPNTWIIVDTALEWNGAGTPPIPITCYLDFLKDNNPDPYYGGGGTTPTDCMWGDHLFEPSGTDPCTPENKWTFNNGDACSGGGFVENVTLDCFNECNFDG